MKKRFISFVMTVVMAATIMMSIAPAAEVNAGQITEKKASEEVEVSYTVELPGPGENDGEIEHPDLPNVYVTIPTGVKFTESEEVNENMGVALAAREGEVIPDTLVATVSVTSKNDYKLQKEGSSQYINYTLTYEGVQEAMSEENTKIADLTNVNASCAGRAALSKVEVTEEGTYTDTLTYTVVFNSTTP